jgi:hypothetical protein
MRRLAMLSGCLTLLLTLGWGGVASARAHPRVQPIRNHQQWTIEPTGQPCYIETIVAFDNFVVTSTDISGSYGKGRRHSVSEGYGPNQNGDYAFQGSWSLHLTGPTTKGYLGTLHQYSTDQTFVAQLVKGAVSTWDHETCEG